MNLRCIIVEDQPPAQRILQKFIEDAGNLDLGAVFSDGLSAIEFLKGNTVDLIFLDIHLPKITGLEFLKSLQNPPHVILTTAFSEYALQGYDLNVVDYLLKPFSFQRFLQAVNKVPLKQATTDQSVGGNGPKPEELYVKSGHDYIKVNAKEIFYINSDSDYTEIHIDGKKVLSNESLKHWVDVLNAENFIQLHKSFIVNTKKIERITGNQVFMQGGGVVPIGRAYKEHFMNRLIR